MAMVAEAFGAASLARPASEASRASLLAALAIVSLSCASATPSSEPGPQLAAPALTSDTAAEAYFPLVDGHIHQFRTTRYGDAPEAEQGLLVLKASRSAASEGALTGPAGRRQIFYRADGIESVSPEGRRGYVLHLPLESGATWNGEHGGTTRIVASELRVTVEAGSYDRCFQTLEERGGDRPLRITTTFCPGVGITALEVSSGAEVERAELSYVGPPIDLGPAGLRRVE
jgi:hypothetical protein